MPPILTLRDAQVTFGEDPLFDHVELAVNPGDRLCLVGRNGSGKTTLLKAVAGLIELDRGERYVEPGLRIAYLPQEPELTPGQSVADFVAEGLPEDELATRQFRVRDLMGVLGIEGQTKIDTLSGGGLRRAAIARALVCDPDLLLLDEPTNHLDIATVDWLEATLRNNPAAMMIISHDRAFLRNISTKTIWMDRGSVRTNDEGYADFERWSEEVFSAEEAARRKLEKRIAAESEWLVHGVTARRKRNQGRLRELENMRLKRAQLLRAAAKASANPDIDWDDGAPASRRLIEARGISKAFDGKAVVDNFTTRIMRGDRIGIVGPNGAGKTTLIRMLTGDLEPDSGQVKRAKNLQTVYFDQTRETLNPKYTLWETLTDKEHGGGGDSVVVQGRTRHVVAYLKDFLFDDKQARQPVGSLSGGERNRLLLAKAFTKPSNLLVLDEPTNDLDMDTLDVLEDLLARYQGTLLLISHDRDFLDRLVTSTISFDPDGQVREYAGGYTDMLRQRKKAVGGRAKAALSQEANQGSGRARAPEPEAGQQKAKPTKLSYKDKWALEHLPGEIEALEAHVATLEEKLGDPSAYEKEPDFVGRVAAELEHAHQTLQAKQEKWLALELLREELEGPPS